MRADPYGEYQRSKTKKGDAAHVRGAKRRERFLEAIKVEIDGLERRAPAALSYAGPGFMRSTQKDQRGNPPAGWTSKDKLDPIFSDYSIICPHLPGFVQPYKGHDGWIVYRAPITITNQIGDVRMVEYQSSHGPGATNPQCTVKQVQLPAWVPAQAPLGQDHLYCFEGGTGGNKIVEGKIWSLMGFILAAEDTSLPAPARPYDVFIVFRGSRSGRLSEHHRVPQNASGKGNPDWVTDLSFGTTHGCYRVSSHETHSGFAVAMNTCLPTIEAAIRHLVQRRPAAPRNIYVTGHSLGGALANCFASAMLCGSTHNQLQQAAPNWPWTSMCVWTFAAPPAGHTGFSRNLDLAVTAGWGTAANWRLEEDVVPTGFLKLPHHSYATVGTDVCLPSKWNNESLDGEKSHSPDWMRKVIEDHLSKPPHNRIVVPQTPWAVINNYKDLIVTVSNQVRQLANRKFYKFKEGLKIYLSAISRMKGDPRQPSSRGKDRFTDAERLKIRFFLGALGRTTLDDANYQAFLNVEFNSLLDKVEQIREKDDDLLLLLKLWLALIAAEDGYNWTANDAKLDAVGRLR